MKILRLDSTPTDARAAVLMADSAWRPDRRPLFMPESGADEEECEIRTAVRIDRLGKCINRQFALRYAGAIALVAYVHSPEMLPWSDDSIIQGTWIEGIAPIAYSSDIATGVFVPDSEAIAEAISTLSIGATFKTGDVITLPEVIARFKPSDHQLIDIKAEDGNSILTFKIK